MSCFFDESDSGDPLSNLIFQDRFEGGWTPRLGHYYLVVSWQPGHRHVAIVHALSKQAALEQAVGRFADAFFVGWTFVVLHRTITEADVAEWQRRAALLQAAK